MTAEPDFQTHLFTYRHDGAEWAISIAATSEADAWARIGKLQYGTYLGVGQQVPIAMAPYVVLSVWIRNAAMRVRRWLWRAA